ncbi:unnamed protein product [Miscanthus lutarioriparius]|uniref:NADP-dependent oxidoreductase domain-containing protein n=1 Tax=Miscanthus lutarioriparius TaxID=422564 RepID=A0A811SBD9_9POAL|nr:unnamed protein product [Miscanthus lutarioriparius]
MAAASVSVPSIKLGSQGLEVSAQGLGCLGIPSSTALQGGGREMVELATKFVVSFADGKWEIRGDPAYVHAACEGSLKRLDIDCIDLYYQHRIDKKGLGCLGMPFFYGPPKPEPDMIKLIHHAVAAGVTLLDTADMYGPHTNEILLGKALQGGVREKVELATKFAVSFADGKWEIRGDPAYVHAACEGSLKRLGIDCIDLYYQHRIDKKVPIVQCTFPA